MKILSKTFGLITMISFINKNIHMLFSFVKISLSIILAKKIFKNYYIITLYKNTSYSLINQCLNKF